MISYFHHSVRGYASLLTQRRVILYYAGRRFKSSSIKKKANNSGRCRIQQSKKKQERPYISTDMHWELFIWFFKYTIKFSRIFYRPRWSVATHITCSQFQYEDTIFSHQTHCYTCTNHSPNAVAHKAQLVSHTLFSHWQHFKDKSTFVGTPGRLRMFSPTSTQFVSAGTP